MKQQKSYTVVNAHNTPDLCALVEELIEKGWVPQGGVSVVDKDAVEFVYVQAMVKHTVPPV